MSKSLCLAILGLFAITGFAADQLAEKWQKRIADAEANYAAAITKADNARFFAAQKANGDRLKVLKAALVDATKAGDFDAAAALKEKVSIAEKDGVGRSKPKNVVKFGGHDYALIEDKVTWHVAKKRCEEMGGHLAIINSDAESEAIRQLCGNTAAWIGATDEEHEGVWKWVDGTSIPKDVVATWSINNRDENEHAVAFWPPEGKFLDGVDSIRYAFICEWE
ncbi:MAG: hepatic lectin-like [Planctomycetaceae bacterium]|nr:hepatic lectin-like [Planctomycetaceae bacterium]